MNIADFVLETRSTASSLRAFKSKFADAVAHPQFSIREVLRPVPRCLPCRSEFFGSTDRNRSSWPSQGSRLWSGLL